MDDEELLKLVCLYAYQTLDIDSRELMAYAREEGMDPLRIHHLVDRAASRGWLQPGGYDWYGQGRSYHLHPACYLQFVQHLLAHRKDGWMEEFERVVSRTSPPGKFFLKILQLSINGVAVDVSNEWDRYDMSNYFWDLFFYPKLFPLASQLKELSVESLVVRSLHWQRLTNLPDTTLALLEVVKGWESEHRSKLCDSRALIALNHYLATGENVADRYAEKSYFRLALDAVRRALQGDCKEALPGFGEVLKYLSVSAPTRRRTAPRPGEQPLFADAFLAYIHAMALAHEGSPASMRYLNQYAEAEGGDELRSMAIGPRCYRPFVTLFLRQVRGDGPTISPLGEDDLPEYAFLRREMADYLPLDDGEKATLHRDFGPRSLLTSYHCKEPWERTLEELVGDTAIPEPEPSGASPAPTRVMYLMNRGRIEVREQNRLRNGQWGAGKVVSASRYYSGQLEGMDERDHAVWNALVHGPSHELEPQVLLPEMVGTDRVYTGFHAPYTPLTITEEKPYLTIERKDDCFLVSASYEPKSTRKMYASPTHIVTQRSTTEYVVTPLAGRQRRFFEELLRVRRFPLRAEEALKAFFPKVSDFLEVHSSTFAEGNTLDTVEGSTTIYLQVTPVTGAFRIRCVVRPLPGGQLTFAPGRGSILVADEADGRRVQVQRALKDERLRMQRLSAYMEEYSDAGTNSSDDLREGHATLSGEQLLGLVEYIRPLGEDYVMEWKEGKPLCVKKPVDPKQWKVELKGQGGWFDLEGEVPLDDASMLTMAQLLQLAGRQPGEFVRLNDTDYLQLTETLRLQLMRLEAVTQQQKGRLRIPSLTAGLLADPILDDAFTVRTDRHLHALRARIAESEQLVPKVPSRLKATLRDYQVDGFQWMARLNHWGAGACLADDMGLGKTVQTIAYLIYMGKEGASLVVAPTSVMPNWQKELARFAPSLRVVVLNECADRAAALREAGAQDVVLTTYGLLVSESESLLAKAWNVVCLDEAHTIKNRETKTSAAAMQLQAARRLILTGTPVQNHLGELWNLFQFINPGLLGTYEQFQAKYILPIEGNHDKARQQQLNRLVHPFMLRRTKQEVVEELPDKEEIVCPVAMTDGEKGVYELIRREAREMVARGGAQVSVATLAQITKLRQAACSAALVEKHWTGGSSKIDRLLDLLSELREGGHRALVFSQFTSFLALVRQALDKASIPYLYLDGATPMRQRHKWVEEFQEGDCPFFLISLKAGGLGLNLTGANYIIHLDPWWNPAIEQQATDRAYRIGQTQKVTAYHLVSAHTIEEKILRLHATKRNLSDALLSGTGMSHKLSAGDLLELLSDLG